MNAKLKSRSFIASLAVPALFLAGCGGGGSGNNNSNPLNPSPVASTNLVAITSDNNLLGFNARTPLATTRISVTGIPQDQTLVGIDYRYAPDAAGQTGLYGLAGSGNTFQLYRLTINNNTATATAVGSPFTPPTGASFSTTDGIGFDFNPNVPSAANPAVRVDRLRLVSSSGGNFRVVPNTGAVVDFDPSTPNTINADGDIKYDAADQNSSVTPRVVGAAYTNNDTTLATGTVNYALDIQTGNLVTQGRPNNPNTPADESVSPNSGRLFTVGNTGLSLAPGSSFDIAPTTNLGLLTSGNTLYSINLGTGATTRLNDIAVPNGLGLRGLAILPG